jgi:hypothetical protein
LRPHLEVSLRRPYGYLFRLGFFHVLSSAPQVSRKFFITASKAGAPFPSTQGLDCTYLRIKNI